MGWKSVVYTGLKISNDIEAFNRAMEQGSAQPVNRRVKRRLLGRAFGRLMGRV